MGFFSHPFRRFYTVFFVGLSKENNALLETHASKVHARVINEYGTIGLLAMLVKTIIMGFLAILPDIQPYFEVGNGPIGHSGRRGGLAEFYPYFSTTLAAVYPTLSTSVPPLAVAETSGRLPPMVWQYWLYTGLLTSSALCIFVSMMTSVGNYMAISMIHEGGLKHYFRRVGILSELPFITLMWGATSWHVALIVLVNQLLGFYPGVIFGVCCSIAIIVVVLGTAQMLEAVDSALLLAQSPRSYGSTNKNEVQCEEPAGILGLSA
jgi:hypothetical protein